MGTLEPADLVLQGGGVKGLALAGAVTRMMDTYRFPRVAGTSAGAIVASLLAAGYDQAGIRTAMSDLNYRRVPDRRLPIPLVGPAFDLLLATVSTRRLHPPVDRQPVGQPERGDVQRPAPS